MSCFEFLPKAVQFLLKAVQFLLKAVRFFQSTATRLSPLCKHLTVRLLSSIGTLISGCLVFILAGTSPLQTLITMISSILGILLAMHLIGKKTLISLDRVRAVFRP